MQVTVIEAYLFKLFEPGEEASLYGSILITTEHQSSTMSVIAPRKLEAPIVEI